jgi:hypothetical protein
LLPWDCRRPVVVFWELVHRPCFCREALPVSWNLFSADAGGDRLMPAPDTFPGSCHFISPHPHPPMFHIIKKKVTNF